MNENSKVDTSAPIEPITKVEERLKEKKNDTNSFENFINIKQMITYFEKEKKKAKT